MRGLFRLYAPAAFGGFELPYGSVQLAISALLGAACGSTAWVQSGAATHAWMVGSFAPEAQAAVWGDHPGALVATAASPSDGRARSVPGGLVLDGTWQFSSGCDAADWIVIRAAVPDGAPPLRWCLVPQRELEIVDVWYATGLRGTGSQDVRAHELFVPDAFTIDVLELRGSDRGLYGLPYMGVFQFTIAVPAIGVAKGALAAFRTDAAGRSDRQAGVARQLRYARSAAEVDAAELVMARMAADFEAAAADGRVLGTDDRVRFKRDASFAIDLCRSAVARLVEVLGAHGLGDDHPIQRALRDIIAIASHHGLAWDSSGALYGSHAFGIFPTDQMAL